MITQLETPESLQCRSALEILQAAKEFLQKSGLFRPVSGGSIKRTGLQVMLLMMTGDILNASAGVLLIFCRWVFCIVEMFYSKSSRWERNHYSFVSWCFCFVSGQVFFFSFFSVTANPRGRSSRTAWEERVTIIKPREENGGHKYFCRVSWKKMLNCANTAKFRVGRWARHSLCAVPCSCHLWCKNQDFWQKKKKRFHSHRQRWY